MNITPLANHILLRPDSTDPVTDLLLPENITKEEPTTGEVIALGTKRIDAKGRPKDWSVAPGQRVAYRLYAGAPITGSDLVILKEEDILGILG